MPRGVAAEMAQFRDDGGVSREKQKSDFSIYATDLLENEGGVSVLLRRVSVEAAKRGG